MSILTLQFRTAVAAAIPLVKYTLHDGDTLIASGLTDAAGDVVIADLDDGVRYSLNAVKSKYIFPAFTALTLDGDQTTTVTGASTGVASPTLSMCRLYGYVYGPGGEPVRASVIVDAVGEGNDAMVPGGGTALHHFDTSIAKERRTVITDEEGLWEVDLVVGAKVQVQLPIVGVVKTFRVPDTDHIDFADVRPELTAGNNSILFGAGR